MSVFYTPVYIKMIKDIIIIILIINSIIIYTSNRFVHQSFIPFIIILLIILQSSLNMLITNNYLNTLAGIRWILPVLLCFLIINQIDQRNMKSIIKILVKLLVVHFLFQLVQNLYYTTALASTIGASSIFGVVGRPGGLFHNPNGGALFSCLVYYYLSNYDCVSRKYLYKILCIISIIFTASATGMLILLFLIAINFIYRYHLEKILVIFLPFVFIFSLINIGYLSGRGAGIYEGSLGQRAKLLYSAVSEMSLIPLNFGSATSTAFILRKMGLNIETIAADSTITAILVNFGLWGLIVLLLVYVYTLYASLKIYDKKGISLAVLFLLTSMTMMVFEFFPVNLLLAITFSTIIVKNNYMRHLSR